jgi:predicted Zn-dependent protease
MLTILKPFGLQSKTLCALSLAAVVVGCSPPGPRALIEGDRLLQRNRPQEAIRHLQTAVQLLPGYPQAWNHLGLAYHRAGKPQEAATAYQRAIRLDPRLAAAHHNFGRLALEQGNPSAAAAALSEFVRLEPGSFEGWRALGQAQLRTGDWRRF